MPPESARHLSEAVAGLSSLYEADETAWLETMAGLIVEGRLDDLDYENLHEFLTSMARRDRREVLHRLTTLLVHLLKWEYQPTKRSRSWVTTIRNQRLELEDLLESGTLRNHAKDVLSEAYSRAIQLAAAETGFDEKIFPSTCPDTLDEILTKPN
jgi:hypothetical protein